MCTPVTTIKSVYKQIERVQVTQYELNSKSVQITEFVQIR